MDQDASDESATKEMKLECPFTWQMDDSLALEYDNESFVSVDDQPIKALMHFATLVYVHAVKNDLGTAYAKVKEMNNVLKSIDFEELQREGISIKVLLHIVRATRYHYYIKRGNREEANKTLNEVPALEQEQLRDKTNSSTLNGCKSLAWAVFFDAPKSIAIAYASRAVTLSPECALWHFVLGKKLRHVRRDDANFEPLPDEATHLLKAYELTGSPYYGVFVAQMYNDAKDFKKAKEISMEIYNSNPQSIGIRLRLALSFIKSKDYDFAKECLDFVDRRCQDNVMYLHYKGIFYEKQKDYQMAALHYNKAAQGGNHKADLQFAKCMERLDKKFNFIKHLDSMIPKHSKSVTMTQQLFLHIAMQFHFKRVDTEQALTYFYKALMINPKGRQLKAFKNETVDYKTYNIKDFVFNQLLPEIHRKYATGLPYYLSDIVEQLEQVYSLMNDDDNQITCNVESMDL